MHSVFIVILIFFTFYMKEYYNKSYINLKFKNKVHSYNSPLPALVLRNSVRLVERHIRPNPNWECPKLVDDLYKYQGHSCKCFPIRIKQKNHDQSAERINI